MPTFADGFQLPFPKSTFGNRFGIQEKIDGQNVYGPQGHRGTDFKVGAGSSVPAIANAEVEHVLHSVALGNVIVLRHYLHGANNDVYSGYCHLSSVKVREGQWVNKGAIIAASGETGTQCYGPHLHLTMSHDDMGVISGEVFDPIAYIEEHASLTATPIKFSPKYTTAKSGEGLIVIAARSKITFTQIKKLNPKITAPDYRVRLGQQVRIA